MSTRNWVFYYSRAEWVESRKAETEDCLCVDTRSATVLVAGTGLTCNPPSYPAFLRAPARLALAGAPLSGRPGSNSTLASFPSHLVRHQPGLSGCAKKGGFQSAFHGASPPFNWKDYQPREQNQYLHLAEVSEIHHRLMSLAASCVHR